MKRLFTLAIWLLFILFPFVDIQAQCAAGETEVAVVIVPDNYPNEISWEIKGPGGVVLASAANGLGDTVCLSNSICLDFTIYDSYGDGICCGFGQGSYTLYQDGTQIATGGNYTTFETTLFGNCSTGSNCAFADTVAPGLHNAPNRDYWYLFTPDSTGTFQIETCGNTFCDTKIWIYDVCQGLNYANDNTGTIFYNDNACSGQSEIIAHLSANTDYYIRIGDNNGSCTGNIGWELTYLGPVEDCMDTSACNYNPLASLPDTCYYPGDTLCPDGPDLLMVQSALETSLFLDSLNNTDQCYIQEGCIADYGAREIVRFTTHIKNIGNQDYYIGSPSQYPQQFTFDNCHGHYHYDGYAEYILYDAMGQPLPIGFKNGFCVLDLECSGGGTAKYGCNDMGISAGCGDIYGSSLPCQWVDVTDVPAGNYTLVVRTNWDNAPDALGRYETDHSNNWAQVCLELLRNASGKATGITIDPNCPVYTDCAGTPYGSAVFDCQGVCDGTDLHGDLDNNSAQEKPDAVQYVSDILTNGGTVSNCTDLNMDNEITVTDAALIDACAIRGANYPLPLGGFANYCDFPSSVTNVNDTAMLRIGAFDPVNQTVDIEMRNPTKDVVAYQFEMSGMDVTQVTNLIPAIEYPIAPQANLAGMVVGISYEDSTITRSNVWRPLVRLSYSSFNASQVCIARIVDIVNADYEDVLHQIGGNCLTVVANDAPRAPYFANAFPNPFSEKTVLEFSIEAGESVILDLLDAQGRLVRKYGQVKTGRIVISRGDLPSGVYMYRLRGTREQSGRLVIQ